MEAQQHLISHIQPSTSIRFFLTLDSVALLNLLPQSISIPALIIHPNVPHACLCPDSFFLNSPRRVHLFHCFLPLYLFLVLSPLNCHSSYVRPCVCVLLCDKEPVFLHPFYLFWIRTRTIFLADNPLLKWVYQTIFFKFMRPIRQFHHPFINQS